MGREWYLNWGTKSSSKKVKATHHNGGGSGGEGRRGGGYCGGHSGRAPPVGVAAAAVASAGGCMNAVLHLFDFQHFQLCLHPQDNSFIHDDPTSSKGLEAPRNSLESITEEEKDYNLHIHKDIHRIKTNRRDTGLKLVQLPRGRVDDFSSESSYSPASARTPNLVARLMGLDILPESNTTTPRSSHSQISPHIKTPCTTTSTTTTTTKTKKTRPSSQETPRTATSTRRRSMEVVDHHRLSLQINKENSIVKEMELSRPSCSAISTKRKDGKNCDDEVSKSPSYYARQIMKQVRETVSRRVGMDITNTINGVREHRRDEHLLSSKETKQTKPKKINKKDHHHHHSSSSPRFKSCDENDNNPIWSHQNGNKITSSKSNHQLVQQVKEVSHQKSVLVQAKSLGSDNESLKKLDTFDNKTCLGNNNKKPLKSYDPIRNKKDEQFVRPSSNLTTERRSKKTMLSSELLHGTVPSLVPLKKDNHSKFLDKEGVSSHVEPPRPIMKNTSMVGTTTTTTTTTTRMSRNPRQRIYEKTSREEAIMHMGADQHWRSQKEATATSVMEFQYITRILKCTGIDRDTPVSFMRWFLPTQPLDPSIFHTLEATHYLTTSDKFACDKLNLSINRKLIFNLVDEMLADILKPYVKHHYNYHHSHVDNHHHHHQQINGFQLVKLLCSKIRSFPCQDCQTLQDIDALVEKDLPSFGGANNMIAYHQDDSEDIVSEIEQHIFNSLVQETFCLDDNIK